MAIIFQMRNFFITLFCLFLISCSTAQEIINSGQVKAGMSQSELRSALLLTYLSEDPFLSGCFRQYFENAEHLIIAAENKTTFFIFEGARSQGTCEAIENGKLAAVRNDYQNVLIFIENNKYSRNFESRYNSIKNNFIHDFKKKLVDLNYLKQNQAKFIEYQIHGRGFAGQNFQNHFHAAIIKFLVDEGECDLALLIKSSLPLFDVNMGSNSFDYCENKIFRKPNNNQTLGTKEIYLYYIFTQEFSTLLSMAWNRIKY